MLGMDIQALESHALPPPTLNLEHQKEQARLDKEDRERQAREREARGHIEALLDKRDEEAKQQRIQREAREAMAAGAAARAPVTAAAAAAAVPLASHPASTRAPVVPQRAAPAAAPAAAAQLSPWDEEALRALQPMRPMATRPGATHGRETGWDLPCTAAPRQPLQRTLYHALREEEDALREEDGVLALQARARGRAVRREREEAQRLQWFGYYLREGAAQGQATSTSPEPIPAGLLPPGTTSWYEAALELATSTAEQAQVAAALRDATGGGGGGAPRRHINLAAPGAATGGFAPDDFDLCPDEDGGGELGEGWRQIDDPEVGTYFFNFRTGDSVWERAQTGVAAPPLGSAHEVALATAAIRLQACARGRAARHRGASLRATARAAVRLQASARGRAVRATPAAKHVPSMPRRHATIDARLQASVKPDEGHMPAAPLAGILAAPESLQQHAVAPAPNVPGGAQVPPRDGPAQVERSPSPSPSGQRPQPEPEPQPQPQPQPQPHLNPAPKPRAKTPRARPSAEAEA